MLVFGPGHYRFTDFFRLGTPLTAVRGYVEALLDGGTRTASVDAVTDMTLLVLTRPAFMGLLDEQPGIARRVMATMATIIRDLEHPGSG